MSDFLFYFQKPSYLIPDAQYDIIAGVKTAKVETKSAAQAKISGPTCMRCSRTRRKYIFVSI